MKNDRMNGRPEPCRQMIFDRIRVNYVVDGPNEGAFLFRQPPGYCLSIKGAKMLAKFIKDNLEWTP